MLEGPAEIVVRRIRQSGANAGGRAGLCYEARKSELEGALGNLREAGALSLLGAYLRSLEEGSSEDELCEAPR